MPRFLPGAHDRGPGCDLGRTCGSLLHLHGLMNSAALALLSQVFGGRGFWPIRSCFGEIFASWIRIITWKAPYHFAKTASRVVPSSRPSIASLTLRYYPDC